MGIDLWQRRELARPLVRGSDEPQASAAVAVSSARDARDSAVQRSTPPAAIRSGEAAADATRQKAPGRKAPQPVDARVPSPGAFAPPAGPQTAADDATALAVRMHIWLLPTLLVVADAAAAPPESVLKDISTTLGERWSDATRVPDFHWPPPQASALANQVQAGRSAFIALLERQRREANVQRAVFLGPAIAQLLESVPSAAPLSNALAVALIRAPWVEPVAVWKREAWECIQRGLMR